MEMWSVAVDDKRIIYIKGFLFLNVPVFRQLIHVWHICTSMYSTSSVLPPILVARLLFRGHALVVSNRNLE